MITIQMIVVIIRSDKDDKNTVHIYSNCRCPQLLYHQLESQISKQTEHRWCDAFVPPKIKCTQTFTRQKMGVDDFFPSERSVYI